MPLLPQHALTAQFRFGRVAVATTRDVVEVLTSITTATAAGAGTGVAAAAATTTTTTATLYSAIRHQQ